VRMWSRKRVGSVVRWPKVENGKTVGGQVLPVPKQLGGIDWASKHSVELPKSARSFGTEIESKSREYRIKGQTATGRRERDDLRDPPSEIVLNYEIGINSAVLNLILKNSTHSCVRCVPLRRGGARAGCLAYLASAFTKSIGFVYKPGELYFKKGEKYVVCAGFYAGALGDKPRAAELVAN